MPLSHERAGKIRITDFISCPMDYPASKVLQNIRWEIARLERHDLFEQLLRDR